MEYYIAPVQGHTDSAWRNLHHKLYGGCFKYFTPFMRLEHGEIRAKDLRDFTNSLNDDFCIEPQVIFRDADELGILLQALVDAGAKSVNLNMGCPFPPQTKKGRGAGFISNIDEAKKLPCLLSEFPAVKFSVKMRLGNEDPMEWKGIIEILNSLQLDNLYVHPRVGRQEYRGELDLDAFAELIKASTTPVVFNGEIKTPEDAKRIAESFPDISGIMVARGILGRPSLFSEILEGEWSQEKRIEMMLKFHNSLLDHYRQTLCGDTQVLYKIKPFWEYAESEIGRKTWKSLRKAPTLSKYLTHLPS